MNPSGQALSVTIRHAFPAFTLDVAFEAPSGVTALFGRSGSGKTTIANVVAGLLRPDAGRVAVNGSVLFDRATGRWIAPHRRRIGYVFQEGRLFPHLTVRRNLTYGAWFSGNPDRAGVARVVDMLGLGDMLERRPGALSGGEKQRVAIGRALLSTPRLLVMDEPLAALDEARKDEILPYLERLRGESAVPILYVSHSVAEVARLATTVVALSGGRVARIGPAGEVLADPQAVPDLGVRTAGALIEGRVAAHDPVDDLTELSVSAGTLTLPRIEAAIGTRVRARIEAHDVILATTPPDGISALNVLPVTVATIREGEGPGAAVGLMAGSDRLLARVTRRSVRNLNLAPGVACYAVIKSMSVARRDVGPVPEMRADAD